MKKFLICMLALLLLAGTAFADDLEDVKNAGVLRFGVTPDRYPFVFYDKNDELTGIDIRLMEEIAGLMGVDLDIYEMSADSLTDSLLIGQVDVAGGAFSKTSERKEKLDFTKIYYSTGSVFVGQSKLGLEEPLTADSFTGLKIGVQKETGFEEWLLSDFIEKETVGRKDIFSYSGIADAMKALDKGRIDLVMMDANVYMSMYQDNPDYRSWQYGSAEDSFAFGIRKTSGTKAEQAARKTGSLKAELDRHLSALLNDGTAQEIANTFFFDEYEKEQPMIQWGKKTETPVPAVIIPVSTAIPTAAVEPLPVIAVPVATATAVPTLPPAASPTPGKCTYNMTYIADVTIPDGQQISAGTGFTKTWRIKNSGTCTWGTNFTFAFVSGSQMNGWTHNLPKTVYPGDTVDISIEMVAPGTPGSYQGNWQLKDPKGYSIGTPIWVKITVPGAPNPSPTPDTYYYFGPVQEAVKPEILWYYPNFYTQKSGQCVNVYWGLTKFSTLEIKVDGKEVFYGGDESGYIQICSEVQAVGPHYIELCAYASGGTTCETLLYTTN